MSDERRTTAVALPGEPAGWRATTRDLLRYLRSEPPSREAAVEWLHEEAGATDPDAAAEQLAFLEEIGVVESEDGTATPGPRGREFLDTHDEGVLYEALTASVGGFETLLESLAVRPLTDVEFRDLLEREFDADLESTEPVLAHRRWLAALGYLEHDDGVNDLTRAGRLRVETDDELTPPRANQPTGSGMAQDGISEREVGPRSGPASTERRVETDAAAAPTDVAEPVKSTEAVEQVEQNEAAASEPSESATDEGFVDLKRRYDYTCMVCGDRRRRSPDEGLARIHHPMPTGEAHGGPAEPANAVVVCPNHEADFECGLLTVDPRTQTIEHAYEPEVSGRTLETADGHDIGAQYLAYHNEVVADF